MLLMIAEADCVIVEAGDFIHIISVVLVMTISLHTTWKLVCFCTKIRCLVLCSKWFDVHLHMFDNKAIHGDIIANHFHSSIYPKFELLALMKKSGEICG